MEQPQHCDWVLVARNDGRIIAAGTPGIESIGGTWVQTNSATLATLRSHIALEVNAVEKISILLTAIDHCTATEWVYGHSAEIIRNEVVETVGIHTVLEMVQT